MIVRVGAGEMRSAMRAQKVGEMRPWAAEGRTGHWMLVAVEDMSRMLEARKEAEEMLFRSV